MLQINEDSVNEDVLYNDALREKVSYIYEYTLNISLLKKLTKEIRHKAEDLRCLILSETEAKERKDILEYFDTRVQSMVYYTINNLENYRQSSWQKLIDKGDNMHE